tara:strand:+ start:311 stop:523 length:213 start_codon:yes stop_codon:yes gene_type:complete
MSNDKSENSNALFKNNESSYGRNINMPLIMDKSNNLYTGSEERKMVDESSSMMLNSKSNSPNIRIPQNIS